MTGCTITIYLLILAGAALSAARKKLTIAGAGLGALIGCMIFYAAGLPGLSMLAAFFIMGVGATSLGGASKQSLPKKETGARNAAQVFANGGLAAIMCVLSFQVEYIAGMLLLLIAAIFSSAAADTVSSETGNVFGKKHYNILNGKPGIKGANGVVSLEGTLSGLAASGLIAWIYGLWHQSFNYTFHIILAGTIGNLADSLLGAILENKGYLHNNAVNFLNTLAAAVAISLLVYFF